MKHVTLNKSLKQDNKVKKVKEKMKMKKKKKS